MNRISFTRGNVLLYVLLGVALFGLLTYNLSKNTDVKGDVLSEEQATLYANQIIAHVQQVALVVEQMRMMGSDLSDLDFVRPGETGFDTAPHGDKVFHPAGGGAPVFSNLTPFSDPDQAAIRWAEMTVTNVAWTESSADDVIYSLLFFKESICEKINHILTGSTTIPLNSFGYMSHFSEGDGSDLDISAGNCADCEGLRSICTKKSADGAIAFYTVIASQ